MVEINRLLPGLAPTLRGFVFVAGRALLIMNCAEAGSMGGLVDQLTEEECAYVVCRIMWAIMALRRAGWHHGDLKPDNLLLDAAGRIWLGDWNLAELLVSGKARAFAGTPFFIAPEVEGGRWESSAYDFRADIHSLGATMAVLLKKASIDTWSDEGLNATARLAARLPQLRATWEDKTLQGWLSVYGYGGELNAEPVPPQSFVEKCRGLKAAMDAKGK